MKTRCPQCNKLVEYTRSNKWRPFCSERCRLIDLGEWIEGNNRIPGEDYQEYELESRVFTRH